MTHGPATIALLGKIADEILDRDPQTPNRREILIDQLGIVFDAGKAAALAVEPVAARTSFGQPADPQKRQGFVLNVVHTIQPEQIAEHGEDALLAWIRQTLRELAANGANVLADASLQIVGMPDGVVVVTGEAAA